MNIIDPTWRLNNFYHVVDKLGKKTRFHQNSVQRKLNEYKQKRRRILKARQLGVSTNELLRMLDFTLFTRNKTSVILAHESDSIEKLFRIVRRAYEFMPNELKPKLDKGGGSKYEMFFPEINSRIYADLESRGDTINWLHISEKAFSKDKSRISATIEAVPIEGIITEETTPNGMNHFYDDWFDNSSNYTNIFLPWFIHEEYTIKNHDLSEKELTKEERIMIELAKKKYDRTITLDQIEFRRFKQRELKHLFKQEYPENDIDCFLTTGQSPFDLSVIKPLYDSSKNPIEIKNGIRIYEKPIYNAIYVIGADTAEGVNGDNSACHVLTLNPMRVVASFNGDLKPSQFAEKLISIAEIYKNKIGWPLLGVEKNNHGHAVLLKLDEVLYYPNLYKTKDKLGWITDRVTRPIMVNTLIEAIENGTLTVNDKETLSECLTIVNKSGKIEAESGKHDDLFMALAISVQLGIAETGLEVYANIDKLIKI